MRTVMKFGGSILSSAEDLKKIVEIVKSKRQKKQELILVASAVKGVTDKIIDCCCCAIKTPENTKDFIEKLRKQHIELLNGIKNPETTKNAVLKIGNKIEELENALEEISGQKELSQKNCALIYPMGERLSVLLLEAHLNDSEVKAVAFDADKAGIVTDECFAEAVPLMKETEEAVKKNLEPLLKDTVPVITGYFAANKKGEKTCFGRGGSDFSAGIIANVLDADALELWKDVDGFMSADPKTVENAFLIKELSYDEAEELGYFGAKILHPRTILPLRMKKIPAIIKNILSPEKTGTVISEKKQRHKKIIKSLATKKRLSAITVSSPEFVGHAGIIDKVFSKIAEAGISIDTVATSETGVSFTLKEENLEEAEKTIATAEIPEKETRTDNDLALIGIVGEGMKFVPGVVGKIGSCLGEKNINIEMLSLGANEINISIIIKEKDLEKAVKEIHKKMLEE